MSRLLVTSALSVVIHGTGVVALVTLAQSDALTPPRAMEIILPDLGGSGTPEPVAAPASADATVRTGRRAPRSLSSHSEPRALPAAPELTGRRVSSKAPVPPRGAPQVPPRPAPAPVGLIAPVLLDSTPIVPAPAVPSPRRDSEVAGGSSVALQAARGPADAVALDTLSAKPSGVGSGGGSSPAGRPSPDEGASLAAQGSDAGTRDGGASAAAARGPLSFATPRYQDNAKPAYPWQARLRGEQGTVLLSVLVDARGRVSELRVDRSSGSRVLDEAAVTAVRRWTFEPGRRGTEVVESWVRIPLRFHLED